MLTRALPEHAQLQYLLRPEDGRIGVQPLPPYDAGACELLHQLSRLLLADPEARPFTDVMAFGYWCRRASIARLQRAYLEQGSQAQARLGRGLAFHIAPANVPANFAYSLAFALLSGNASVVRVPSKDYAQVAIIVRALRQLLRLPEFAGLAAMTALVRYPHDEALTAQFSAMCDARLIWGGDQAIAAIRRAPIPSRGTEVAFADRYSFCAVDAASVLRAGADALAGLAEGFYNDVFQMDQNACSSPHLLVWLGAPQQVAAAQQRFWPALHAVAAARMELQAVQAVDKYTLLCRSAVEHGNVASSVRHGNHVYRIALDSVAADMDALRGKHGLVYEFAARELDEVAHIVNSKYQTLTYFGLDREQGVGFVLRNRLAGIDRIVPVGSALDMGVIWDGYDIVRTLSRIVDFV
jgi:hypothetical protein